MNINDNLIEFYGVGMCKKYSNSVVNITVFIIIFLFLSGCKNNENSLVDISQYSNSQAFLNVYLKELSKTHFFQGPSTSGSYLYYYGWYKEKAPKHRLLFRMLGLIVLLLSVVLPVIVTLEKKIPKQKYIIIFISLIIALSTGINSFYRFDVSWKGYISAQMQLDLKRSMWEAEIAEAKSIPDDTEQLKLAKTATDRFITGINEIIQRETTGYFEFQKLPKKE